MPATKMGQYALTLPADTTANRPANSAGLIRFNTSTSTLEVNNGTSWITISSFSPTNISGLVGWYDVGSVSGSTWTDKSGSGNNATLTGSPTVVSTSGNGASFLTSALQGNTSQGLYMPSGILPPTYTFFHVTRLTSMGTPGTSAYGRIWTGADYNWLSGHWASYTGVAHHMAWLTASTSRLYDTNWFISTDQNTTYRSNGVDRTTTTPGTPTYARLVINGSGISGAGGTQSPESSNWQVAEAIIYNRTLSLTEIQTVENYLAAKYGITLG